jgi:hypothetical protein
MNNESPYERNYRLNKEALEEDRSRARNRQSYYRVTQTEDIVRKKLDDALSAVRGDPKNVEKLQYLKQ